MILANARAQLTRRDAALVVRLIARGSDTVLDDANRTLAEAGLDPLLDDPRLLEGLLYARQGAHASLTLFVYVVVRHALRQSGEQDRLLADYVASVVLQFGMRDRARRLADYDDATYDTLVALGAELDGGDPRRSFLARTHLGNYALWVSGLFPDHVEQRRWRRGGPDLGYFEVMGRKGFQLAATHRLAREHGLTALFEAAADRFPQLRVALNRFSDRLLFPHVHTPERLMRQVRDGS